jgi:hypothetical protein
MAESVEIRRRRWTWLGCLGRPCRQRMVEMGPGGAGQQRWPAPQEHGGGQPGPSTAVAGPEYSCGGLPCPSMAVEGAGVQRRWPAWLEHGGSLPRSSTAAAARAWRRLV